jgi:hypothetical protein
MIKQKAKNVTRPHSAVNPRREKKKENEEKRNSEQIKLKGRKNKQKLTQA